jgi:phytoene synthase
VGQLCVEIFGCKDPEARRYADELGLALQLTNILRDVDEDAARGRIYLPREDLESFHVSAEDLRLGRRTPNVMRLLRFEAQRARLHFLRARATQPGAERARLVVADIMGDIYYALLEGLEFAGFPHEKLRLGRRHRAALALRRYARARLDAA